MPPPIAVSIPARTMMRRFIPNRLYANVAPITVKTPRPIASNFKKRFQCFLSRECKRNMITPVMTVIMTYDGSINEFGSDFPNTTSRIVPPATPVIVAKIIMPTMSALCSIALNAPVTANAIVPKRSKI